MLINKNAESVGHISSCQPNFLPLSVQRGKLKPVPQNFAFKFFKILIWCKKAEWLVSCLYQTGVVSAAVAAVGPLIYVMPIRKQQVRIKLHMCAGGHLPLSSSPVLLSQVVHREKHMGTRVVPQLEALGKWDSVQPANRAEKWQCLDRSRYVCFTHWL